MAASEWFPDDLTDTERNTGFEQREIVNPDAHYVGETPTLRAVIYPLSSTRRIVKIRLSGNRIGYQLQRFGRYTIPDVKREPEWLPDLNFSIPDPVFAVQYFQTALAKALGQGALILEVQNHQRIDEFLEQVYRLASLDDLQGATDRIFETVDRLLLEGAFIVCDEILRRVDVRRLPTALMRSFLTITAAAKDKLPARKAFYDQVLAETTRQKGSEKAQKLLGQLA